MAEPTPPSPAGPAVIARDLHVHYQRHHALRGVSLELPKNQVSCIVGPNGSGKSTALKALLGLVRTTGEVTINGSYGYMPQHSTVDWTFPATVTDVVLMGMYREVGWFRRPGKRHRERALAAMEHTGVADLAHRQIGALSGGQRQRVFLARTLAQDPYILLMDEPFAGVDVASERKIVDVLTSLTSKTLILVHHDLSTVRRLCDYAVVLAGGELVAAGEADSTLTNDTLSTAYQLPVSP